MGIFSQFLTELSARSTSIFSLSDNLIKIQWIFTNLGFYIDIVDIWLWIANGQISSIFDSFCLGHVQIFVHTLISVNMNGFSSNLPCALIL